MVKHGGWRKKVDKQGRRQGGDRAGRTEEQSDQTERKGKVEGRSDKEK